MHIQSSYFTNTVKKLNYTMFCSLYSYTPSSLLCRVHYKRDPTTQQHNNTASMLINLFTLKVHIYYNALCRFVLHNRGVFEFGPFARM